jgi:hypothetical protein
MKLSKHPRTSRRIAVKALVGFVLVLTATNLLAQSPSPSPTPTLSASPTPPPPTDWPTTTPYDVAICAFDKALTRAARDKAFRDRLTDSCDSAKQAIAEIGNLKIPCDRKIVFFEMAGSPEKISADQRKILDGIFKSKVNEGIHVFFLPEFKPADVTTEHRYEQYFLGFYDAWKRASAPCKVP